jgi:hypothetical protein
MDYLLGSAGRERSQPLPGDELVEEANEQAHTVTIDALPEQLSGRG